MAMIKQHLVNELALSGPIYLLHQFSVKYAVKHIVKF